MNGSRVTWVLHGLVALGVIVASTALPARAGVKVGDDKNFLNIGLLLQGHAGLTQDAAYDKESWDTDLFLRRTRILFSGQLSDKVNFFVETDATKLGKEGDFSANMFIQDAWVEFNLHPALQIDVGMLILPFSHQGMQGATTLHALDYHLGLMKYPARSQLVWRDFGVMARGLFLNNKLEYRFGIFNGVRAFAAKTSGTTTTAGDPRNPHDAPRMAGRLAFNLFDSEGGAGLAGFFYKGINLKPTDAGLITNKKIVSIGVSADWQPELNGKLTVSNATDRTQDTYTDKSDYYAIAADVFVDYPIRPDGLMAATGQVDFYYYNHGERAGSYYADAKSAGEYTGYGIASEVGVRYDKWEPVLSVDWFDATESTGDAGDTLAIYGGVNWWYMGHAANVKLQFGGSKKDGAEDFTLAALAQVQLLF